MDSVNIKNFNTLKTMEKIFSIPPGPKHIVEAANYLYGTENEFGSKINETSAYNYFSGTCHVVNLRIRQRKKMILLKVIYFRKSNVE